MLSINKKKYFRIIAFLVFLTTFLPVIQNNLPAYIGSYHLFAPIWVGSVLLFNIKIIFQKSFLYLLFYGILFIGLLLNTLWLKMDDWNRGNLIQEFYVFTVALSIYLYFIINKDYKGLALLVKWAMIFIGITAIMSIYSASVNPLYARKMIAGDWQSVNDKQYFDRLGGGGYSYAAALLGLFPMLVYYYRNIESSIFSRKIIITFGIICFLALLNIQIFANILLSSIIIIIAALGRKRIKKSLLTISVFLVISIIIPVNIYADLLISASSYFDPTSDVNYKLNDMADFLVYDDYNTSTGGRAARYPILIETFLQNPLTGYFTGSQNRNITAGGHLYWMNKLTILGLFGFLPFLIIHFMYIKNAIRQFDEEFTFYFLVSVFAIIGLGLMKNLAGRELWFTYFILLPGFYYLPILKKKNYNK